MSKKYIVSNWKNLPKSWAEAEQLLDSVDEYLGSLNEKEISLVFCPPVVFVNEVGQILMTSHLEHQAELGVQDISLSDSGAGNEKISGPVLNKLGVRYVIVGHSEKRWKLNESDEMVNEKLREVLKNEMTPIVCLGEKERDVNFKDFLRGQTEKTFAGLSRDDLSKCIIAYEPVWAISTNPDARPDTPESAVESISIIQETLNTKYLILNTQFLYGGSVTSQNVVDFIKQKEIDGVLIGGASVNKDEFIKILSLVK